MFNLIRMNIYRAIRTKSTWIIIASMVAIMVAVSITNGISVKKRYEQFKEAVGVNVEEISSENVMSDGDDSMRFIKTTIFGQFADTLAGSDILLFATIFTVIFVFAEEKNGYVKNIVHCTRQKWNIYLAKLPILLIYLLVLVIVYFLIHLITFKIINPNLAFGMNATNVKYALIILLAHVAYIFVVASLTAICKSAAAGITFGLLPCFGIGFAVVGLLNLIFKDLIDFSHYFILTGMNSITVHSSSGDLIRECVVFVCWLVIGVAAGMIVTDRRDVV